MLKIILHFILAVNIGLVFCNSNLYSQTINIGGQLSAWGTINTTDSLNTQLAARYIPSVSLRSDLGSTVFADIYLSVNSFIDGKFNYNDGSQKVDDDADFELHRAYARFAASNLELRVGLQRINFGSALLMRPLMWFDSLDPRDPQQYSKGVYAVLFRWYFYNNANTWIWGLYGNDEVKGWEVFPSVENEAEFGGRIQYPLFTGEIALSFNQRRFDLSGLQFPIPPSIENEPTERKYAFDTRWDIEIGFWSEIVLVEQENIPLFNKWRRFINIGSDYTLDIGNGIGLVGEYFEISEPEEAFGSSNPVQFWALSVSYSLGIADEFKGILYYHYSQRELYRFVSWSHTLDNWRFILNSFWNPVDNALIYNTGGMLVDKGVQLTITFNH
ncbi:MAG: hypothetical protein GF307_06035 [candidate division Zixibacteria bacterium]|nr:hypothetical protein [candidate division Zixibacteria bacterium]